MAYSPASTLTNTAGVNHLATVFYDKAGVSNFKAHLPFYAACESKKLPLNSGKVMQFFTYNLLAANTTPGTEGAVGTGLAPGTTTVSATINQYFDFMTFSDLLVDTAIDPIVANAASELGYRAGLTVNSLTSAAFDVAVGLDSTSNILATASTYMTRSLAQQAVMSLRGKNVRAKDNGDFYGIIHPLAAFDLWNDSANGGTIDWLKHTESGKEEMQRGIQAFRVARLAGCTWIETTTVPTSVISTKTNYHSYVVGKDAILAVGLGDMDVPNGDAKRNFGIIVKNNLEPSAADPAGVIGATAAYNFKYGVVNRPGSGAGTQALRRIQCEVSIA